MKTYSFPPLFIAILCTITSQAQVGIGTTSPDSDTMLEIETSETKTGGYGLFIDVNGLSNSSNPKYGIYSDLTDVTGSSFFYGKYNLFDGVGSSINVGSLNNFTLNSSGSQYGFENKFSSPTSSFNIGLRNTFTGTNPASHMFGMRNFVYGDGGFQYGMQSSFTGTANIKYGIENRFINGSASSIYGIKNDFYNHDISGNIYGVHNRFGFGGQNQPGDLYGFVNEFSSSITSTDTKYGLYNIMSNTMGGTHYGVYSDARKVGSYAGYFLGNVAIGTFSGNTYLLPSSRGTANQIIQTDGSGNLTWENVNSVFTDNQTIDLFSLTGTTLNLSLEDDGVSTQTVNLSSLQDGTGTDNQNITGSGLSGTNLTIGIEGGTSQSINLSSLQDGTGTDDQNITGSGLSGTNLTIGIEGGTSQVISLASLNTGGDITAVTAGAGLTGGGTTGAVTLNAAADNGLYVNAGADRIKLGGVLNENTTITQGVSNMVYNLTNSGDFIVQDNGINHFQVDSSGIMLLGDDTYWRDGSTTGTNLMSIIDDGNDGRFRIFENGITSIDLDANSQFIFNEQGLDRDFRIEGNSNENVLFIDAGTNSIGVRNNAPSFDIHLKQSSLTQGGTGGIGFESTNNTNNWKIYHSGSHFSFSENGTRRAYVEAATGDYIVTSDKRLKKNITKKEPLLAKLQKINIYEYHYKDQADSDEKILGVMAQEVLPLFPSLVSENEDGNLGVNYAGLSVVAIKAIKEQQIEIESLKEKLVQQEKDISEIKKILKKLN